jgi:hypothetical protein
MDVYHRLDSIEIAQHDLMVRWVRQYVQLPTLHAGTMMMVVTAMMTPWRSNF